jgi:threonine/homoserine/homoserine lactone efflux protein
MAASTSLSPGRRTLIEILVGAVLGFSTWSFAGPRVISWWYEPPSKLAISCGDSVSSALSQFVMMQLVITVVGGAVVALLMFMIRRWMRNRAARSAGTPTV